jgi:hypothetical protein
MAVNSPVRVSDNVFTGEAKSLRFTITDSAGVVANISGWTLSWKLEPAQGQAASVTKTGAITDGPNGVATVTLAASDTAALAGGTYFHHLDRTDSGFESVLSAGTFALQPR